MIRRSYQLGHAGLISRVSALSLLVLGFPFKAAARIVLRAVQVLLALFFVVLHPQIKWLWQLFVQSTLVKHYVLPSLQTLSETIYEPYFRYLKRLPPYWATFSIALPLAILEPAKLFATILIAERPKMGIVLWLLLQGLSFILIDKTWTAVRPQSRRIWLVSRIHAWGWLNVSYGKYWFRTSAFYQTIIRWKDQARLLVRALFSRYAPGHRSEGL